MTHDEYKEDSYCIPDRGVGKLLSYAEENRMLVIMKQWFAVEPKTPDEFAEATAGLEALIHAYHGDVPLNSPRLAKEMQT